MNYRLAQKTDIDRLVSMAESAKAYFRENGIEIPFNQLDVTVKHS